jgi:hypothetical protein
MCYALCVLCIVCVMCYALRVILHTMVTMGGDLQTGCLANCLLKGVYGGVDWSRMNVLTGHVCTC